MFIDKPSYKPFQSKEVCQKKAEDLMAKMKKENITEDNIEKVIKAYSMGFKMSEKFIEKTLPKVTKLFNQEFRCCKNGAVFCWRDYYKIIEDLEYYKALNKGA